jgi:hypothetical protein
MVKSTNYEASHYAYIASILKLVFVAAVTVTTKQQVKEL